MSKMATTYNFVDFVTFLIEKVLPVVYEIKSLENSPKKAKGCYVRSFALLDIFQLHPLTAEAKVLYVKNIYFSISMILLSSTQLKIETVFANCNNLGTNLLKTFRLCFDPLTKDCFDANKKKL